MRVSECPISGLALIQPEVHVDNRGYFISAFEQSNFNNERFGFHDFVQDNISMSYKGVLRGLHFQKRYQQAKLIRVIQGVIFDVAVDIQPKSPTFGKWYGVFLSDANKQQLYIPNGFAHGFLVYSEIAKVYYKVSNYWAPEDEGGIVWNDPDIDIHWPGVEDGTLEDGTELIISKKDQKWGRLADLPR